jgi:probable HAF family extracellular repeat protein
MYSIQELTSYEGSGGIGLNNNGDAVGYANDDPVYSYVLAAIWFSSGGKYVAPHITDASNLNAINSHGVAVGFLGFPGTWTTHAMMVKDGLLTDLTSIPNAQMSGEAYAINSSGIVCADGGLLVNVASTPMTATPMPAFAGYDTLIPFTINDDGDVAGACSQDGAPEHGFLYHNGSYWDLGPNDEGDFCLNNNRTLVGSIPSPVLAPAVWQWDASGSAPTLSTPPLPPGFASGYLTGINDSGMMVGAGRDNSPAYSKAFISNGTNSTDLNLLISDPSWDNLDEADAINNSGQIVGTGRHNGLQKAFLLSPARPRFSPSELESLLQYVRVSLGVMVDGGGWTSGGPVDPYGPISAAWKDALIGLAMDAASNRVSDIVGREAIRLAALEMTRKSVDRLIAQAKTPASSLAPSQQGDLMGRRKRGRLARRSRQQGAAEAES